MPTLRYRGVSLSRGLRVCSAIGGFRGLSGIGGFRIYKNFGDLVDLGSFEGIRGS